MRLMYEPLIGVLTVTLKQREVKFSVVVKPLGLLLMLTMS